MAIAVTRSKATHRAGATIPAGAPASKPYVTGELPLPTFTGNGSAANINWSDGGAGGSFNPVVTANAQATTYTPPNKTMVVTVTAVDSSDAGNTGQNTLTVTSTIPLNPQSGYDTDTDQDTEVSYSRDKTPVIATHGPVMDSTPLQWIGRISTQWQMLRQHWLFHKKAKMTYFFDQETDQLYLVRWDSALKQRKNGANNFDMSGTVKGQSPDQ